MRILTPVLISAITFSTVAQAGVLERQTARYLRNAGYVCDSVSDMRVVKGRSNQYQKVVLVTCDDGYGRAVYEVTLDKDDKVKEIKRQ